jgi:hypothetical protein
LSSCPSVYGHENTASKQCEQRFRETRRQRLSTTERHSTIPAVTALGQNSEGKSNSSFTQTPPRRGSCSEMPALKHSTARSAFPISACKGSRPSWPRARSRRCPARRMTRGISRSACRFSRAIRAGRWWTSGETWWAWCRPS